MYRRAILMLCGLAGVNCSVKGPHPHGGLHGRDVASSRISNPCVDLTFTDPIYQVASFEYQKIYSGLSTPKTISKAVVRDVANNHTWSCSHDPFLGRISSRPSDDPNWYWCSIDDTETNSMGHQSFRYHYKQSKNTFDLSQEWLCWNKSGFYPWAALLKYL